MAQYRLYFIDRSGTVGSPRMIEAASDLQAMALAQAAQDACADRSHGVELWQGNGCLAEFRPPFTPKPEPTPCNAALGRLREIHSRV
jgi:hypothetical protein